MKTIKETKEYYVPKHEEIVMFETIDGRKFHKEEEAKKHEEAVLRRREVESKYKTRKISVDDYGIDYHDSLQSSELLYVENLDEETKKDLIFLYPYLGYSKFKIDDIKLGWNFFIETEYDSCSLGRFAGYDLHIYGLDNIIKEKEEQLKKLKEIQ
jgi:hypothetical protein